MSHATSATTGATRADATTRYLPLMLLLFVGSGAAALIYQIVWFQVLQLVIGSSAISLAVLLGTFMGGMCIGSLLLTRYVGRDQHPLVVYAKLEALIGVVGAALIVLMPLVGRLYTAVDGGGPTSIALRAIVSMLLLLPPTILMGATLPAISRYVESTPAGVSWLGFFYGGNIVGAVIGCLTAGFYLLRVYNLTTASLAAVALNLVVAGAAMMLARVARYAPPPGAAGGKSGAPATDGTSAGGIAGVVGGISSWQPRGVYVAIGISGLTALGAEVIWTRLLSLMFGATTYAFSVILAAFLIGLGIGSIAGSAIARDAANPRAVLGWTQLLLAFTTAWGAWLLSQGLPYWPVNASLAPSAWFNFQLDFARALFLMLPGAVLWGASFPIALAAATTRDADPGRTVGRVYAANTLGAIAGALVVGIVVVPMVGTQGAQRTLIVLSVLSAIIALAPLIRTAGDGEEAGAPAPKPRPGGASRPLGAGTVFTLGIGAFAALWFAVKVPPVPAGLVAWGRSLPWQGDPNALYVGEGINSSIAVTELSNGWRNFHVSGKVEASTEPQDMRLQRLLGHLTALMHPEPKNVLVVGFGAGVTAGAISVHPAMQRMVICELEPLIPRIVSTYFHEANHGVKDNPRVEIIYDDARHYMLTTNEKFDVITSDPIHPWVKGAATLYTEEYFEHVKARLNPGGVVTQWVPLYESTEEVVKSEIATFLKVFPNGTVWRNDDGSGAGYDVVLVGRLDDTPIDIDAWQARINSPENARVRASLAEVGYPTVFDILRTYSGGGKALAPWVADAEINRDSNLRLQYLAGFGFNYYRGTQIRDTILRYRVFPAELFTGTASSVDYLRTLVMDGYAGP